MKWRTTAIYLMVLLVIGGIYLVMEAKQKESARREKESRRVLVFDGEAVKEIEIKSAHESVIHIEKTDKWRISQPIASDIDRTIFADFFSALQNIEKERSIGKPSDNMGAFGLDKPHLVIRMLVNSQWLELQVGGKNVDDTARYARAGEGGDIFMMSSATYSALSKDLRDLRRKELFTWQPDEVKSVNVRWQDGDGLGIERQGGANQWKSAENPDFGIKARKVQNLLDDFHWMRAVDFTGKDAMPASALVEIRFELKDGKVSQLKVANSDKGKNMAIATCTEIEGAVLLPSNTITTIPRSFASLADHSLISSDAADAREISWENGTAGETLVWLGANSWGVKKGDATPPKAVKDLWVVRSFLSFIDNVEYIEVVKSGSGPAEKAAVSVRLTDVYGKTDTLAWDRLDPNSSSPVSVLMTRDGTPREVKMKRADIQKLNELVVQMGTSAKGDSSNSN